MNDPLPTILIQPKIFNYPFVFAVTTQAPHLVYAHGMKTFIGIDVRQRQHYAVAITEQGQMSFVFTHRRVGFENFSRWVSQIAPLPRAFAVNKNEPFSSAVAVWLRANGETVHVVDCQGGAQQLAESLKDGLAVAEGPDGSVGELLDLAMFYLKALLRSRDPKTEKNPRPIAGTGESH